jgi:hypothetical protein
MRTLALAVLFALPQQKPTPPEEEPVRAWLSRLAEEVSVRSLGDVKTLDEWKVRREGVRTKLLSALRLDPLPGRTPIERIVLDSLPDSLLAEPMLLNAARMTDVPERLGVAVPSGLLFMGRPPLGFERVRGVARLLGKPGLAIRAASMEDALDEIRRGIP